ncbi:MAG TPA: sigma-70 family RNA polymerase sigma factor [Blastocatellia bacterium]|nr:sigma-70 family RNA polymerase sigma factor [Blastocatellia bacterium]
MPDFQAAASLSFEVIPGTEGQETSGQRLGSPDASLRSEVEGHKERKAGTTLPSDSDLVAAVLDGDEAAFETIFERYRRLVAKIAFSFFPKPDQVEELIQESFTKAYFSLSAYRGEHERSFAAWISRITVSTCYDALRKVRHKENKLSDLNDDEINYIQERVRDESAASDIEQTFLSRDLAAKLLDRLEPDDRLILTLLEVAGYSVAEIAEMVGWTVPKVKMRAFRARLMLRNILHKFV